VSSAEFKNRKKFGLYFVILRIISRITMINDYDATLILVSKKKKHHNSQFQTFSLPNPY